MLKTDIGSFLCSAVFHCIKSVSMFKRKQRQNVEFMNEVKVRPNLLHTFSGSLLGFLIITSLLLSYFLGVQLLKVLLYMPPTPHP